VSDCDSPLVRMRSPAMPLPPILVGKPLWAFCALPKLRFSVDRSDVFGSGASSREGGAADVAQVGVPTGGGGFCKNIRFKKWQLKNSVV
jgi:hypothetical protein